MPASPVTLRHYTAIFLVAFVTLAAQVLISRILSVTLHYHYAFAGITFAMLGLTAGSLRVYQKPEYFSAERANAVLAEYGSRFGLSLALAVILHVWLPGQTDVKFLADTAVAASLVALLFSFIESGVCIALLLTRFPSHTSRLYAFDLGGAALGCISVIGALMLLDPVTTVLILCTALAFMGWRFLPPDAEKSLILRVKATAITLSLLVAMQLVSSLSGTPFLHLTWAKHVRISVKPEYERWNTYSRIAVTEYGDTPFGWGFGKAPRQTIEQKFLTIDADAATILTRFDGKLKNVLYLNDDVINLAYHVKKPENVAAIGVGGGRDVLSALVGGAKHITGIELNPAILKALTGTFGEFTSHLDQWPQVKLINAEARSYLSSHPAQYDLIQISLIDTWAATVAGGLTLSENKLYTTEAWNEFLDNLSDKGVLSVSRWYDADTHRGEFYRMLAIASDVLKSRDPKAEPRQHILAAAVHSVVTLMVSKSPYTAADIAHFKDACRMRGFTPLMTPDYALDDTSATLAAGKGSEALFNQLPIDVRPPDDDKPFFFHMLRLNAYLRGDTDHIKFSHYSYTHNAAIQTLLTIFAITLVASLVFIISPLVGLYKTHRVNLKDATPHMLYFAGIGLGFMLIEISQMQRLMIFLGHPVYGLGVVLFTLLLASSIGSYTQRNLNPASRLWLRPVLLCTALIAIGLATPHITAHLKYFDTMTRIITSSMMIAAMGFFMGMMFPVGVAAASVRYSHLLPWFWGINGAASIFASVLAVMLSLQCGISATFWTGVACYGVCLWVTSRKTA